MTRQNKQTGSLHDSRPEWQVTFESQRGPQWTSDAGPVDMPGFPLPEVEAEGSLPEFNFDLRRFIVGAWQRRYLGLGLTAAVTTLMALFIAFGVSREWQAATTLIKRSHQDLFSLVERDPFKTQDYSLATLLDTLKLPSSMNKVASEAGINVAPTTLAAALNVSLNRDSTILNLKLTWSDPDMAADLVNRVADQFIDRTRVLVADDAAEGFEYYSVQLVNAREKARMASADVMAFRQQHGISDLDTETKVLLEELSRLRGEYNARLAEAEALQAAQKRLASSIEAEPEQMIMYTIYRSPLKSRLAEYEWELQEARAKYTEENPKVVKLKERIDALNRMIRTSNDEAVPENTYTQNNKRYQMELRQQELGDEIQVRQAQAEALAATLAEMQNKVNLLTNQERDYLLLKSRLDGTLALENQLARRVEETRLVMQRNDASFDIVERATPPVSPQPSGRKLLAVASLLFAAGASMALILLLEWRDPFVRSLRDATDIVGHENAIEIEADPGSVRQLIDADNPIGQLANLYRRLCNDIDAQASKQQSLGIISISAGEGRSTVAANLAVTRTMKGQCVLLADADLRPDAGDRPDALLDLPAASSGLYERLLQHSTPGDCRNAESGVDYLAAGCEVPDARGLLSLGACDLAALLAPHLKQHHCLVDLPPVKDLEVTLELAAQLDGVVLVVRSGHTNRPALKALVAQLEKRGIPCAATVVLDVPRARLAAAELIEWPDVTGWMSGLRNKEIRHA
jgi:uncharacterized protein involved in exopolysaccharide biosynthesis/Mrp family chromosome partitioning ATPase